MKIIDGLDISEIESDYKGALDQRIIEFGLVAVAHNIRKYIAVKGAERSKAVCSCL